MQGLDHDFMHSGRAGILALVLSVGLLTSCSDGASGNAGLNSAGTPASVDTCSVQGECAAVAAKTEFGKLVAAAVFVAPETAQAKADLTAARAAVKTAQNGNLPLLGLEARGEASGTNVAVVSLKQPLWSGGKLRAAKEEAQFALAQAEANLQAAQFDASLRIIDAFGRWVETSKAVAALQDSQREHDETLAMIERRLAQGVASGSESELVAARRATIAADLLSAMAARDMARAVLTSLSGGAFGEGALDQAAQVSGGGGLSRGSDLDAVLARHPNILAADAAIARATAAIKTAKSEKFPLVSLVGESQLGNSANTANSQKVYLGVSANVGPGKAVGSRVAAVEAQVESLTANRNVRLRGLRDEITALGLRYEAANARIASYSNALRAAQAVLASYRTQMQQAGGKSWQDVLGAVRDVTEARKSMGAASAEAIITHWKLKAYVQGLEAL